MSVNRINPTRLPTCAEAETLARGFERNRIEERDPAVRLQYAVCRNLMNAFAAGRLVLSTQDVMRPDLVAQADALFGRCLALEVSGPYAGRYWQDLRTSLAAGVDHADQA